MAGNPPAPSAPRGPSPESSCGPLAETVLSSLCAACAMAEPRGSGRSAEGQSGLPRARMLGPAPRSPPGPPRACALRRRSGGGPKGRQAPPARGAAAPAEAQSRTTLGSRPAGWIFRPGRELAWASSSSCQRGYGKTPKEGFLPAAEAGSECSALLVLPSETEQARPARGSSG